MLVVNISVHYSSWLDELSEPEFETMMKAAESKCATALANEIFKAEEFWRARKMASMAGQTDIFDYV